MKQTNQSTQFPQPLCTCHSRSALLALPEWFDIVLKRARALSSSPNDPRHGCGKRSGQTAPSETLSTPLRSSHMFTYSLVQSQCRLRRPPQRPQPRPSSSDAQGARWEGDGAGCESCLHALRCGSLIFRERAPCHGFFFFKRQEPGSVAA